MNRKSARVAVLMLLLLAFPNWSISADPPAHFIPVPSAQTYALLKNVDGVSTVAVTMSFAFFKPGVTTSYLSHYPEFLTPSYARKTPEGLQCLLEDDLARADYAAIAAIHNPPLQPDEVKKQARGEWPANVVTQLRHKTIFGNYVYLGVNLSPMPELPVGNLLKADADGFSIIDHPKGLALKTFNMLSQNYDDFMHPSDRAGKLDARCTTLNFDQTYEPDATLPSNAVGKSPGPGLAIHVLLTPVHDGPWQKFFDLFYAVFRGNSDDDVCNLFAADSRARFREYVLQTANDYEEFQYIRASFRSGTPDNLLLIDGRIAQYLIFTLTTAKPPGDQRINRAESRLFICECCREKGEIKLTYELGGTDQSLLTRHGNLFVPSTICEMLVEKFSQQAARDPAPSW